MEIIENLITDLNELNEREFETEQEKLEWLKDLLKDYTRFANEEMTILNQDKSWGGIDEAIEREHFE